MRKIVLLIVVTFFISAELFSQVYDRGFPLTVYGGYISNNISVVDNGDNLIIGFSFKGEIDIDPNPENEQMLNSGDGENVAVCKYDKSGELLWHIVLGNNYDVAIEDITTDNDGNIYLIGSFEGRLDFDPTRGTYFLNANERDGYWAKYNTEGRLEEAHQIDEGGNQDTGLFILHKRSEVFVVSKRSQRTYYENGAVIYDRDVYIRKYNKTGELSWKLNLLDFKANDNIKSIDVDKNGNFYVSGNFRGTLTASMNMSNISIMSESIDGFVIQVTADGNLGWFINIGGDDNDYIRNMKIWNDNIYLATAFNNQIGFDIGLTAYTITSNGMSDNLLLKYSLSGELEDFLHFGSDSSDVITDLDFDKSGNVLLTGIAYKSLDVNPEGDSYSIEVEHDFSVGYAVCYTPDFDLLWAKKYNGETGYSACNYINVNSDNEIYIAGSSRGQIDLNPDEGVDMVGVDGVRSDFISVLRPYFTQSNIVRIEFANAIRVDVDSDTRTVDVLMPFGTDVSNIEATVALSEGAALTGEMPSDYTETVEIEVVAEDGVTKSIWTIIVSVEEEQTSLFQTNSAKNIKVYPNPVSGVVNIKVQNEQAVNYKLLSFNGALIKEGSVLNGMVDLHEHPAGLYLLEIFNADIHQTFKLHVNEKF